MGFGLHVGWAIEGPIGSEYKIDASYLSPHVHMASRLEAATKGYGASMLITGAVYDLMTSNKSHLRQVDRVIPDGESEIMNLYTVDLLPKHLFEEMGVKIEKTLDSK
jgi:class 3 adenylate cyclase